MRRRLLSIPILAVAAACVLGANVVGQTAELRPQRVIVVLRDAGGRPWSGAQLHLHGGPGVDCVAGGKAWHVTGDGGARGRARLELPSRMPFDAWAVQELADGRYRVSDLHEGQRGDAPLHLRAGEIRRRARIRFEGLAAWKDEAPLRVEQHVGQGRSFVVPARLRADGTCELPPFPGPSCLVRLRGKSGLLLLSHEVDAAVARESEDAEPLLLKIHAPRYARIELVSKTQKGDLEDIRVEVGGFAASHRADWTVRPFVRKGNVLDLVLPLPELRYSRVAIRVRADGHAWTQSYRSGGSLPTKPLDADTPAQLKLTLLHETALRGRLFVDEETPAAGAKLFVLQSDARRTSLLETAADGSFEFRGLPARQQVRFVVWLSEARRLRYSKSPRELVEPVAFVHLQRGRQEDQDLGKLRLDRLTRLTLRIVSPDGSPAAHATVALGASLKLGDIYRPLQYRADRRGELHVLVPRLDTLEVAAAMEGTSFCGANVQTNREDETGVAEKRIELPRSLHIRGRVLDGNGTPLPGARVYAHPMNFGNIPGPGMRFYQILRRESVISDSSGRFEASVPAPQMRYYLVAQYRDGSQTVNSPPAYHDIENEDLEGIELNSPWMPKK